ncbi:glutamate--tRNA ligase [Candidatus Woesearchaeota archaeon]|jgi:glutamyl-tRNA synthetase|nr:glutamate--tRNA ligase [Candidatus Woesearchaeota archaeon]MBT4150878.1 glutamate--tRNA ligase [Candidatus Woesearchaeota archaeon]MBT4246891.1 glutamate--tRNA ligase [Candidatus Woesearchaeota archaeon]MBT4433668.1 glutamate--tRNA ligase [Candidatus Woesearchaeota archaeon]
MKDTVRKFVLKNALDFKGSVNPKAILGLILRSSPEFKKDFQKLNKEIESCIADIKDKDLKDIKKELEKLDPNLLKEKKKEVPKGPLKPLRNAEKGKVVVRIAPSPSGALHIGHAYGSSLNALYAQMYNGKFILRIEDTNPENIYSGAYKLIEEDAQWLTNNNVSQVIIQSERLETYYKHAKTLVDKENAYVCTCDADTWREMKNNGEACACRSLPIKEQQDRYQKMFKGFAEGEAVLRLKTDIKHKNPAMRDFGLMRINDHLHPKTKKASRVWPLMVLSVAIDDHELGVTHVLNGKDHADNAKKETMIMELLGWKAPEYQHWGRINFEGFTLSTSKTRIAIEQNEYTGWDDVRLPFLPALRKRGYQSGAFQKFSSEIGLSLTDKTVSVEEFWKMINAFNKDIIEPTSNRYFFVEAPVKVTIKNAPEKEVKIDLHQEDKKRGARTLQGKGKILIQKKDRKDLVEKRTHRLMDYCNFEVKGEGETFSSQDYEDYKNAENKGKIIHWLPDSNDLINVEIIMGDNSRLQGKGESGLKNVKEGDIVQFERFAFARLDKKEKNKLVFWYLHK